MQFLIKFWYSLPRFQFFFKVKKYHLDSRSYDWYLQRKNYGFDERILWSLSDRVDILIRLRLSLPKEHHVTSSDFKSWFLNDEFIDDVKWFSYKVDRYIEWECPYFPIISKYVENQETYKKEALAKYKLLLDHRLSDGNILDAEINFLHKHNIFGW